MRSDKYSGVNSGPLKDLNPVLTKWVEIMQDPEGWGKRDAPWWYNERASLSQFAGAVWLCNEGWAFEEYATKKYHISRSGKKREKVGRGDIMFGVGRHEYVAEAKQCWPNIGGDHQTALETINKNLKLARKDSARTPNYRLKRLGIVFASPILYFSKKRKMDFFLASFINDLSTLKDTCLAWTFPDERRYLKAKNNYFYPGAVLIIKPLKLKRK